MASQTGIAPAKNNRRKPRNDSQSAPSIAKASRQASDARKSLRSRLKDSGQPSVSPAPQLNPSLTNISQPPSTKRKPCQEPEAGERLAKRSQASTPPRRELSEKNLREFLGEEMDPIADNSSALKRASSRLSITGSEPESVRSQRSSNITTAHYRYKHLKAAYIFIQSDADPPNDIQAAINRIINAEVPHDRRVHLLAIAQEFHDCCKIQVENAKGEDNFVNLFRTALNAMISDNICLLEKADWHDNLKPKIQRGLDFSFLKEFEASNQPQEVDNTQTRPPKRQQQYAGPTPTSSRPSRSDSSDYTPYNRPPEPNAVAPPATPRPKEPSLVKTPRPDISIGIKESALRSALSAALVLQNYNETRAGKFLGELQEVMSRKRGEPEEPGLSVVPTQRASGLVFPFAVVEGKAYSTGKQIFQAQNQAAVSGASGLKIQLSLNEIFERTISFSDVPLTLSNEQLPLFFSICTEGPYHELWAHYSYIKDGVLKFNQVLLEICNAMLLKSMTEFIVLVDKVLCWGTGNFQNSVVERLGEVAKMAEAEAEAEV